jgi:hypothetical protein
MANVHTADADVQSVVITTIAATTAETRRTRIW